MRNLRAVVATLILIAVPLVSSPAKAYVDCTEELISWAEAIALRDFSCRTGNLPGCIVYAVAAAVAWTDYQTCQATRSEQEFGPGGY